MTASEVEDKWRQLIAEGNSITGNEFVFNMRVRHNPHHPLEDRKRETQAFMKEQTMRFAKLKADYINHREYLIKAVNGDPYRKDFVEQMEKCVVDDMERIVLS